MVPAAPNLRCDKKAPMPTPIRAALVLMLFAVIIKDSAGTLIQIFGKS